MILNASLPVSDHCLHFCLLYHFFMHDIKNSILYVFIHLTIFHKASLYFDLDILYQGFDCCVHHLLVFKLITTHTKIFTSNMISFARHSWLNQKSKYLNSELVNRWHIGAYSTLTRGYIEVISHKNFPVSWNIVVYQSYKQKIKMIFV